MYKPEDLKRAADWMVESHCKATYKSIFKAKMQHFFSVSGENSARTIIRKMKDAGLIRIEKNIVEII